MENADLDIETKVGYLRSVGGCSGTSGRVDLPNQAREGEDVDRADAGRAHGIGPSSFQASGPGSEARSVCLYLFMPADMIVFI